MAFVQLEAYISDSSINLGNVLVLITILEMVYGNQDRIVIGDHKLKALEEPNYDLFTYYTKFQYKTANVR
jgi:hypothetical protein